MNLLLSFQEFIKSKKLFHAGDRLLVAVSGGLDSVVLCELCHLSKFQFSLLHANFQLRGEESERDEQFVQSLSVKYQVPFITRRFETTKYAEGHSCSIQEAARTLRYQWFEDVLQEEKKYGKPVWLLTAHHADDNVETQLMNLFKGTGMKGLKGIQPKRDSIVRPLLFASRQQLEQFAADRQLEWVEDTSNKETRYTRNYFRQQVIPLIEKVYPQAYDNLRDNLPRFNEAYQLYIQAVNIQKKKLLQVKGSEIHLPIQKLKKVSPLHTLLYEILVPYGFKPGQTTEVLRLMDAETGSMVHSHTHRVFKNRNWLIIAPLVAMDHTIILLEKGQEEVLVPSGRLVVKSSTKEKCTITNEPTMACLDEKLIVYPLLLRRWRAGDYFYPLGMRKKKKVSRFLIDLRLSKTEKEDVWVVESGKKIIWVMGHRIDDRFKILPNTQQVLQLHWLKTGV